MPQRDAKTAARHTVFDLYEAGETIMRQNLRRQFPHASDAEIERRLASWLHERPGAEHGDAPGRLIDWHQRIS